MEPLKLHNNPGKTSPELVGALQEELRWAEQHANNLTIAEHNRKWFSGEVARLRAAVAKVVGKAAGTTI